MFLQFFLFPGFWKKKFERPGIHWPRFLTQEKKKLDPFKKCFDFFQRMLFYNSSRLYRSSSPFLKEIFDVSILSKLSTLDGTLFGDQYGNKFLLFNAKQTNY